MTVYEEVVKSTKNAVYKNIFDRDDFFQSFWKRHYQIYFYLIYEIIPGYGYH